MKAIRYLPLLLALPAAQALADSPIKLSHPATPSTLVNISNISGEVTVTAWDRNEVQVDGRLGDGAQPLAITGSDDHLAVKVEAQGKSGGWFNWGSDSTMGSSTLELHVPKGASLKIDVISAPLGIDGIDGGDVAIKTISGKVRINARMPSLRSVASAAASSWPDMPNMPICRRSAAISSPPLWAAAPSCIRRQGASMWTAAPGSS